MKRGALLALAIALATVAVYGQTLGFEFTSYDDPDYVTANPHVQQGLGAETVRWAFTTFWLHIWHPATWLSYMLDVELFGLDPAGFHAMNVALHVGNALLLFGLLATATGRTLPSAGVAALFALHPLHVESVAWISERKDVLSTAFWLLGTWAYVGYARRGGAGRMAAVALLFALGLLSKPMLVTFPFTLLLLDVWPLGRTASTPWTRLVAEKAPLFVLTLAICGVTLVSQDPALEASELPIHLRLANASVAYAAYLVKTVWPLGLAALYPHPYLPGLGGAPLAAWKIAGALALLLAISAAVLRSRRAWAIVGWLWYLGTLLPVIGVVQVGNQAMADRYTYVPLIGIFVVVCWGLAELHERLEPGRGARAACAALALAVLVVLAGLSWRQAATWRSSITLYERVLEVSPRSTVAHTNLGMAREARGELDVAIEHYRAAGPVALGPLGAALERRGDVGEALAVYERCTLEGPHRAQCHFNLGVLLEARGRREEAAKHYRGALELEPGFRRARRALARVAP